jgi:hypothetical protein
LAKITKIRFVERDFRIPKVVAPGITVELKGFIDEVLVPALVEKYKPILRGRLAEPTLKTETVATGTPKSKRKRS